MKHSEYIKIVTDVVVNSLRDTIVKGAIKQFPFLSFGPWNFALVKIATKIAQMASEEAEMRIFFHFIDFRTDAQAKDFEAAMIYNNTIQKIGTEDEKVIAEKNLKLALERLISLRT